MRVHVSSQFDQLTLVLPRLLTDVETQSVTLIPSIKSKSGFGAHLMTSHTHAWVLRVACADRMASTPSGEIFHCDQHVFVQLITYEVGTLRRGERKTVLLPPLLRVMLSESVTQKSHLVHTGLISLATISNQFNLRFLKIASSSESTQS